MAYIDDFADNVSTKQIPTKKKTTDIILDFSKYSKDNWLRVKNNLTLSAIQSKGGAIWLNTKGELCYRFSNSEAITVNTTNKTNTVFINFLGRDIKFLTGTKEHQADVKATELYMIQKDEFSPRILQEFYEHKSLWYRNVFIPSKYLQMTQREYAEPKVILSLIKHLANNNEERMHYIINWLAYFFIGLQKSQVALVLRGSQGAGKGILFDNIIKPLFGAKYCIQVNDKTLDTSFLGGVIENRLFINLNEISHNVAGNKKNKNFLKDLVTAKSITAEKKNITIEEETPIYGQVLITSNEPYVIEVETTDRRYTVYETGENLSAVSFLGLDSYSNFAKQIKSELENFSLYLKSYNVDIALANTAQDTKEKRALVNSTNDKFKLFADAVKKKDKSFFSELEESHTNLYELLVNDFSKNRVNAKNITNYFNYLFDEDIKPKGLLAKLRAVNPLMFDISNQSKSNGIKFYKINISQEIKP